MLKRRLHVYLRSHEPDGHVARDVAALMAERHGWAAGIVDGTPVRHEDAPPAAAYGHEEAKAEAARFLEGREYLPARRAQETLEVLRR